MKTLANAHDREVILTRLASLRPDSPRQWGRMTPTQAVCHLADSFRSGLGLRYASPIPASDVTRRFMRWGALHVPVPWPKGVPTRPEVDQLIGGSAPTSFEEDRRELVRLIHEFCRPSDALTRSSHPFFGKMPVSDWLRWGYLHTDHHLRQFGV
jgi:hypothetical protein